MDAENKVDGEDGKPDTQGETPSEPAQGEGAPASAEPPRAAESAGQVILLGAGAPQPEAPAEGAEPPQRTEPTPEEPMPPALTAEQSTAEAPASEASSAEAPAAEAPAAEELASREPSPQEAAPQEPALEEVEPRSFGQTSLATLPLEQLLDDATFRIRPAGEVAKLATDVARLGQLFPVDVRPVGPDRYQIICGFRRVAALRFLKRDKVQARIHTEISDEDALLLALAAAIHASPVEREQLEARRAQWEAEGLLSAATRDMLEKALATEDTLAPESVEEEVDADELAADAAQRLGALNQDLNLLADVFTSLDESRRAELLMQLRYSAELVAYLEGLR